MSNNKPGRKPRVSDDEIFDVFRSASDPVLTTSEVASALPIKKRGTHNRLVSLEKAGEIAMKDVGSRSRVWWLPEGSDSSVAASTSERGDRAAEPEESPERDERASEGMDIDALDLPGSGETEARRREAVRAVCERIESEGRAKTSDLKAVAWEADSETYSDAQSLWKNCVYRALSKLDQFESQGHSGQWVFVDG